MKRTLSLSVSALLVVGLVALFYIVTMRPATAPHTENGTLPNSVASGTTVQTTPTEQATPSVSKAETMAVTDTLSVTATVVATNTAAVTTLVTTPITSTNFLPYITATTSVYTYQVVAEYPHDPNAFTQGLVWEDGGFYEGTGLYGRSSLRRVTLESGAVERTVDLPAEYFGEGIVVWQDRILQLTWLSRIGFIYDKATFEKQGEFTYPTEGWGITHDGIRLIMSDGTSTLYFWDPETLAEIGRLQVVHEGRPVVRLNELEYIDGLIYANIWQTDRIAVVHPDSGAVVAWIDLTGLLKPKDRTGGEDVLNGIAFDADNQRLFVTGKLWPKLYEIELVLADE